MSTIPQSYPDAIDWTIDHLANWPADPTTIGLDEARILELTALKDAAAAALANARQLDEDKKAAYAAYHAAGRAMRDYASQSVGLIRGFAKASDNPSAIYSLAQIPAPADPAPAPTPGKPTDYKVRLLDDGSLEVTFECDNEGANAVSYEVRRRDGTAQSAPFQFIKNAGERRFVDDTIPYGTSTVVYRVVAFRTTGRGDPAIFMVTFGAGNSAQVVMTGEDAA
ncbi:MAG: hypothetical protein ACIAS6_05855 [Phycisphaerales bacterium JB060]